MADLQHNYKGPKTKAECIQGFKDKIKQLKAWALYGLTGQLMHLPYHDRKKISSWPASNTPELPTPSIEVITITPQQHFKQTAHHDNPKIRWFNGHFITARELNQVME